MEYIKLLIIAIFMFGIVGLNPALAQDPVPWTEETDCYKDCYTAKCTGDLQEFNFLVGLGAVYSGSTQQLFIDEGRLSWSQRAFQLVQIRAAGDAGDFRKIPAIIDVVRYSNIVQPRHDIESAKNNVIYALKRAALFCASSSISSISRAWRKAFRNNPIPRRVFLDLQTIQTNEGCDGLGW